jgi:ferredoxin
LTVERVKRALDGLQAFLLVANSRGVNVWCAATGGLLTHHDVVSVIKTSGIQELVNHRCVIIPQLAATGIEARRVEESTGWHVVWGPVEATDISEFLSSGLEADLDMRTVGFGWSKRLEMAAAWAFPMSVVALLGFPWWPHTVSLLVALIWSLSGLIFLAFPLYRSLLGAAGKTVYLRQASVGLGGWILFMFGLWGTSWLSAGIPRNAFFFWGMVALVVVGILCLDLMGSTPVYKSGTHEDRQLRISLDEDLCTDVGVCGEVCPTHVIEVDGHGDPARLVHIENCVQCGACVVQCPLDALYFRAPDGSVVSPQTIRRFKLNLLGKRLVGPPSDSTVEKST